MNSPDPAAYQHAVEDPVPWTWLDALLVAVLTVVATTVIASVIIAMAEDAAIATRAAGLVSAALGTVTSVLIYVGVRFPQSVGRLFGTRRATGRDVLAGAGHGLAAFVVLNIAIGTLLEVISQRFGYELPPVQRELQEAARDRSLAPLLLAVSVILAPLAEELFFRGMLFQALRRRLGAGPGAWLSGVLFALVHIEWLAIALFIPLGAYLAWIFQRRGTLAVPIAAHATFNLLGVALLILAPEAAP